MQDAGNAAVYDLAAALKVGVALHKNVPAALLRNTPAIAFPLPSFS